MFKLKFILIFVFSLVLYTQVFAQDFDYDAAIKIAEMGDDLIKTVKGKLIYIENQFDKSSASFKYINDEAEIFNEENSGVSVEVKTNQVLRVINYLYDRDAGKQRYDMEDKTMDTSIVRLIKSYDGEKTTMITYYIRKGIISPEASISYEPFESPYYTPFYYGYYLYRNDISEMLRTKTLDYGKHAIINIEYDKSETVRNILADVFSGIDNTGIYFKVWLSNKYLYRPVKIFLESEGDWGSDTYIEYIKTSDNIFIPDKVEHNIYVFIDGNKEYMPEVTIDYVIDETTINVPIDTDEFVEEIHEGLEVIISNSGN